MIQFEINDKIYKAKSLTDLSITAYEKVMQLTNDKEDANQLDNIKAILNLLTGIEVAELDKVALDSFLQIDFKKLLIVHTDKNPIKKTYLSYSLKEFNSFSLGKFIDIEYYISGENPMIEVVSRILKNEEDYEDVKTDIEKNLNILDAFTILEVYLSWRTDIFKQYDALFVDNVEPEKEEEEEEELFEDDDKKEEEEEEKGENSAYQWLDIANGLAGHILKLDAVLDKTIIQVLNWLSYEHKKNETERAAMDEVNRKQNL